MSEKNDKKLQQQLQELEKLTDALLTKKIADYRKNAHPDLTPHLIRRWVLTEDLDLKNGLYEYFLDTQKQEELDHFMNAIQNVDYSDSVQELVSVLWQSKLDASEYFEELIHTAIRGNYMTIIEVSTVVDSFDKGIEEQAILDAVYQISEAIDEEEDAERRKLLENLRQITNELYSI